MRKWWIGLTLVGSCLLEVSIAAAAIGDVQLLPTKVDAAQAPVSLGSLASQLDELLTEAVQDFEMTPLPSLAPQQANALTHRTEASLVELARQSWVVAPQLSLQSGTLRLRLVVVAPGSETLWVRSDSVQPEELPVLALGLLRELLASRTLLQHPRSLSLAEALHEGPSKRSAGRAVLALHGVALGGYLGVALQRASGSDDSRLAYPLAALGAGVGLGLAMVVSEEWNVTPARAWYLGAGALWPTVGILLVLGGDPARGFQDERHLFGLLGAAGGLTLATAGLSLGEVDDGGAVLTHSGALGGLLLGGLTERFLAGDASGPLRRGMGWGALAGVGLTGALASQIDVPLGSDLLLVDLSAALGGLAAAALGTPLLLTQEPSKTRDRLWIGGVILGALTGGMVGYRLTGSEDSESTATLRAVRPLEANDSEWAIHTSVGGVGVTGWGLNLLGHW